MAAPIHRDTVREIADFGPHHELSETALKKTKCNLSTFKVS